MSWILDQLMERQCPNPLRPFWVTVKLVSDVYHYLVIIFNYFIMLHTVSVSIYITAVKLIYVNVLVTILAIFFLNFSKMLLLVDIKRFFRFYVLTSFCLSFFLSVSCFDLCFNSLLHYCVPLYWWTVARAVLFTVLLSTGSDLDLAWFSSRSSEHLCIFGLNSAAYIHCVPIKVVTHGDNFVNSTDDSKFCHCWKAR